MTFQFSSIDQEFSAQKPDVSPALSVTRKRSFYRQFVKHPLDVALTLLALPIVAPVVVVLALLVMLDGHNPFYSQMRVGKNGRSFRMWKLRTMVPNADEMLESYLAEHPAARLEWNATQKLKRDPRVTWLGFLLRKTSLDELPQLWNVLNGTMSLVGPRPIMVNQRDAYTGHAYFNLRPGLTGAWQVSDRNNCDFIDRVRYDDLYDNDLSFRRDFGIMLETLRVVARGTGC